MSWLLVSLLACGLPGPSVHPSGSDGAADTGTPRAAESSIHKPSPAAPPGPIAPGDAWRFAWRPDADGDGHGDASAAPVEATHRPYGYVADASDCDDDDALVHPGAPEVCDGVDDDCDGRVDGADDDEAGDATWYLDGDGDGWGATARTGCAPAAGETRRGGDCDDTRADVHPRDDGTCGADPVVTCPFVNRAADVVPLGDVDGNGAVDVAVGCDDAWYVRYEASADGGDVERRAVWSDPERESDVRVFGTSPDLDGDGAFDVVFDVAPWPHEGREWPSTGVASSAMEGLDRPLALQSAYQGGRAAVADLDADDRPDLVVGGYHVEAYRDVEAAHAGPDAVYDDEWATIEAVADLDGDGVTDVLVETPEGIYVASAFPGADSVADVAAAWLDAPSDLPIVADIDGDGVEDLIVAGSDGLSAWRGPVAGDLADRLPDLGCAGCRRGYGAGDLDGDGDVDLLVADDAWGLSVLRGPLRGELVPERIEPHDDAVVKAVVVGDLDHDGTDDIATTRTDASHATSVRFLRGPF